MLRKHELEPGMMAKIEIEVRSSVTRTLTVGKIREGRHRAVPVPKEAVIKERLRDVLPACTNIGLKICVVALHFIRETESD